MVKNCTAEYEGRILLKTVEYEGTIYSEESSELAECKMQNHFTAKLCTNRAGSRAIAKQKLHRRRAVAVSRVRQL